MWAWHLDEERTAYCKACGGTGRACDGCENACPPMWMENAEIWDLWMSVHTQLRAGGMGIIGLDYPAVFAVARLMEIEMDMGMFHKIRALERVTLAHHAQSKREK